MGISAVGDIVMDVMKAADPAEAEAARTRLAAGVRLPEGQSFSVNDVSPPAPVRAAASGDRKPFQRFEAMVLQNFIETMLPKGNEAAYGGGMAGDMWRGLMAEKVSGVIAERGGIGIADRLLADHYKSDGKAIPIGPASAQQSQAGAGQAMLSSALVDQVQRKTLGTLGAEAPDA